MNPVIQSAEAPENREQIISSGNTRRPRLVKRQLCSAIVVTLLLGAAAAHSDVVTDWNVIMAKTAATTDPFLQTRSATIMHLAMFEAVNAIVGDYEPYLRHIPAQPGASPEAAAIAAAHRVLVVLHPDSAPSLDALRTKALATIPNGPARKNGVVVGKAAANAILAQRANDGSSVASPYTPGIKPGDWRPTLPDSAPAFRPGLGSIATFGIKNGAQFRLSPPPAPHSRRYTRDYNEVKKVGQVNCTERPRNRTDAARFYAVTDTELYFIAARQVSKAQGKTLSENARIFALVAIAISDGAIACFDTKYFYNLWRPITAIRAGATDNNPKTEPDRNWLPLIPTPPFPSYPSGHATFGAAARRVLEEVYGTRGLSITLTNPLAPGIALHYTSWKQITDDINESRIYGGVHYRFDQEAGTSLGKRVGAYILQHKLRPVRGLLGRFRQLKSASR
jgi:membrane-associated phospholipid phosphatase